MHRNGKNSSNNDAPENVYEATDFDTRLDLSGQGLISIPDCAKYYHLCTFHLQNNSISEIPDTFFPSLPFLMWLDLRKNRVSKIPQTIAHHTRLSHLLIQNNQITELPNELGTLPKLRTLKVSGNNLIYPGNDVVNLGSTVIIKYLRARSEENESNASGLEDSNTSETMQISVKSESSIKKQKEPKMSVELSDRDAYHTDKTYKKNLRKCPKLTTSRLVLPRFSQTRKYLQQQEAAGTDKQTMKMRQSLTRELAQKKTRKMLEARDKILQDRKNIEVLKEWRMNYREHQHRNPKSYKFDPHNVPFDTDPDHIVLLSRDDIEKDLPDKYRKALPRRCKTTLPKKRTHDDISLAHKIKQLFTNLEKINLNRECMTPRTEQKMLLNEINKISEIKKKLNEISHVNFKNTVE